MNHNVVSKILDKQRIAYLERKMKILEFCYEFKTDHLDKYKRCSGYDANIRYKPQRIERLTSFLSKIDKEDVKYEPELLELLIPICMDEKIIRYHELGGYIIDDAGRMMIKVLGEKFIEQIIEATIDQRITIHCYRRNYMIDEEYKASYNLLMSKLAE